MLVYKQRYKPRTSRAFTKADLTVYDSASNTALNTLTVYGKSEVVDGSIKSAGEGYAIVDLGTLNWTYNSDQNRFYSTLSEAKVPIGNSTPANIICSQYPTVSTLNNLQMDKTCSLSTLSKFGIKDTSYGTDTVAFESAMSGILLCYELADPTQGNTIAIKTDNGSGTNGTMAVLETGTPLRGIPNTDVRDVMTWDGSAGTVTKKCGEVDLGTLNWTYNTTFQTPIFVVPLNEIGGVSNSINFLCPKYNPKSSFWTEANNDMCIGSGGSYLNISNSQYRNPNSFKTAMSGIKLVYELATPTIEQLTTAENASIAGLRTFEPQTHAENNAQTEMTVDYMIRVPTI